MKMKDIQMKGSKMEDNKVEGNNKSKVDKLWAWKKSYR